MPVDLQIWGIAVLTSLGVTCKKGKINRVYLRLDRALATNDWINMFNGTRVLHLVDSTSDHCTLLIVDSITVQPS